MVLLETHAIVLHAFDYLETSRIVRLATRDAGVQTVIARGARRSSRRFGSALDLFVSGMASIQLKEGRDLQQLLDFDVLAARRGIAHDLDRFASASMLAELAARFVETPDQSEQFDALTTALDSLDHVEGDLARVGGIAAAWQLIAVQGFAPSIDLCARCHDPVDPAMGLWFSHKTGGILCARCGGDGRLPRGEGRALPADARRVLRAWLAGAPTYALSPADARAHARLLREFLLSHVADASQMRAFPRWMQRFPRPHVATP